MKKKPLIRCSTSVPFVLKTCQCRGKIHPSSFKSKPQSGYLTLSLISVNSWSRWCSDWRLSGEPCSSHTHTHTRTHTCTHADTHTIRPASNRANSFFLQCLIFPAGFVSLSPAEEISTSLFPPWTESQFHMTGNHFLSSTLLSLSICHDAYLVPLHEHSLFHSVMKKGLFCQFSSP